MAGWHGFPLSRERRGNVIENQENSLLEEPRLLSRVTELDPLGEGAALPVCNASEGVRLRPADAPGEWALADAGQWGEACLMLGKDTQFE